MRAFLDAGVLIRAVERPQSEAAKLVAFALQGRFEAVVDERVLTGVRAFFEAERGAAFATRYVEVIRRSTLVVSHEEARRHEAELRRRGGRAPSAGTAAGRAAGVEAIVRDGPEAQRARSGFGGGLYSRRDFARCVVISLIVGTALVGINVRPQLPGVEGPDAARILLNYVVPFLVASASAVLANRARLRAGPP